MHSRRMASVERVTAQRLVAASSYLSRTGALFKACRNGSVVQMQALLSAGADPNAAYDPAGPGARPLHAAAARGYDLCVFTLLEAGADPAIADQDGYTPLHCAAGAGHIAIAATLLAAAPQAALLRAGRGGWRPLDLALQGGHFGVALHLLCLAPLPPPAELLLALEATCRRAAGSSQAGIPPLYSPLVARLALTPLEWARVPSPCPGLHRVLPAVLARSKAEAALLVRHLPADDRERLRTAALCLARAQRVSGLPLPAEHLGRIMALALAGKQASPSAAVSKRRAGLMPSIARSLKSLLRLT